MASNTNQLKLAPYVVTIALASLVPCTAMAQAPQGTGCVETDAAPTKAPTESASGPDSGTKNMGSTGWSGGGMGGSHNDTTSAGPTPGSKTEHPETAKGLDPIKPETNARKPC
jgi:hypothetical protein